MRPKLTALAGREVLEAAVDVRAWGYPRDVRMLEIVEGAWFRYGEGVFWIVADAACEEGEVGLHIAAPPDARGTFERAEFLLVAGVAAEILGFETFAVTMIGEKLEALAARYGWTKRGARWYLSVRG